MKKLLGILTAITLTATTSTAVISCSIPQGELIGEQNVLSIGKDINRENAVLDSTDNADNKFGITNYFILGDSLSDMGGIETLSKELLGTELTVGAHDKNMDEYQNGSFTNGKTAGVLLGEKLGFQEQIATPGTPGNSAGTKLDPGNNYAIGGATAYNPSGATSMLLGEATILKQARELVAQHKNSKKDLIFFEIGGNDLFAMMSATSKKQELHIMNEAVENIKLAMYTLLNNGFTNILFMDAPNVKDLPAYNTDKTAVEKADKISKELAYKVNKELDEIKGIYENDIFHYNLSENFEGLLKWWDNGAELPVADGQTEKIDDTDSKISYNVLDFNNLGSAVTSGGIKAKKNPNADKTVDKYFFFDSVHPTHRVHEKVSQELYKAIEKHMGGNK